ncbi:hypothetical protein FFONT_0778 [Fervidicoccus fontis Kam940]|uniref:Uncharacterized protein n=1 Tax=Fervidicoccus fontis (strain DSM 19380 / JCM 18336 / VKM B-2539 / Kam940) TaxID=1163730 RepID=I0A1A9_FERFK|nr:hypothetical protein FFONT_0778 [Fervidicoccus fontis Kam940]
MKSKSQRIQTVKFVHIEGFQILYKFILVDASLLGSAYGLKAFESKVFGEHVYACNNILKHLRAL